MVWKRPKYGVPKCPICSHPPTIRRLGLPVWGHFCFAAGMNLFWTDSGFWSPQQKLAEAMATQAVEAERRGREANPN